MLAGYCLYFFCFKIMIDVQKILVLYSEPLSDMQLSPELDSDDDILNSEISVNTNLRNIKVLLTMWATLLLLRHVRSQQQSF